MNDQLTTAASQPAAVMSQDAFALMVAADARRNRAIQRHRTAADVYNAALTEVNAAAEDLEISQDAYTQAQIALLQSINRSNGGDVDFSAPAVQDASQAIDLSALEIKHAADQVIAQTAASIETSEAEAA